MVLDESDQGLVIVAGGPVGKESILAQSIIHRQDGARRTRIVGDPSDVHAQVGPGPSMVSVGESGLCRPA